VASADPVQSGPPFKKVPPLEQFFRFPAGTIKILRSITYQAASRVRVLAQPAVRFQFAVQHVPGRCLFAWTAGANNRKMKGNDYLQQFALPNFFFFVTTAYDVLRHRGVPPVNWL
jgi:hypothetical protein